jgi:hypothetical protein
MLRAGRILIFSLITIISAEVHAGGLVWNSCAQKFSKTVSKYSDGEFENALTLRSLGNYTDEPQFADPSIDFDQAFLPLLPRTVVRLNGTYAEGSRENCMNAVFLWHGIITKPRYVGVEEFESVLETEFEPVPPKSSLLMGDVVVHRMNGLFVHAAVIVNKQIVWHKAAFDSEYPYTFAWIHNAFPTRVMFWKKPTFEFYRRK